MNKQLMYFAIVIVAQFFISSCHDSSPNREVIKTWEDEFPKTEIQWFNKADSTYRKLEYFKNRQLRFEKIFIEGDLEKVTAYYETGEIQSILVFESGELVAGYEYFKNGQKMGEVPKELDGKINGPVKYYYNNGNIRAQGEYKNDKRHGIWRDYDEHGNIISEKYYGKGKEIK